MGDQDLGVTLGILLSGLIEAEAAAVLPADRADDKAAAAVPPVPVPAPSALREVEPPPRGSRPLVTG